MPHDQPVLPVETGDGHRFELIRAGSGRSGETVLWLPGMGLTARQYIPFARALAGHGFQVFIHEWRGAGSSSLRASRRCDWGYRELLEEDLAAALETIGEQIGGRRILFGGHSLGAQFACMAAGLQPDPCAGVIILAGGTPHWRAYPLPMKAILPAAFALMPAIAAATGFYPGKRLGFAGREARGVVADWARTGRTGVYRPTGINTDLESAMAGLQLPVLALSLADDWFVPEPSVTRLTAKLAKCRVTRQVLDARAIDGKADHYGWMKAPGAAVAEITRWAREHAG